MFRLQKLCPARCTPTYVQQIKATQKLLLDIQEQIEVYLCNAENQSGGSVRKIFLDCKLQRTGERLRFQLIELRIKFGTLLDTLPSLADEQFEPSLWGCRRLRNVHREALRCQQVWETAARDRQDGLNTSPRKAVPWSW